MDARVTLFTLGVRSVSDSRAFYERLGAQLLREEPAPAALGAGVMDAVYGFPDVAMLCSDVRPASH